jgi:predicted esterase
MESTQRSAVAPAAEILQVPTIVHGRVLYESPAEPTALLIGFHGYAQLGEDALAYLRPLAEGKPWAIAAPQALHPFYRPKDQAVVAGWMTRLDREIALEDNVAYTTRAVAELRARMPGAQRLAIVGFSQGVAMAYRTAARCGQQVDAVVALAGDVPPELRSVGPDGDWGSRPAVLIGRGDGEQWYSEEKLADDLAALAALDIPAEVCRFAGGHEWAPPFVERARAFLAAHLA